MDEVFHTVPKMIENIWNQFDDQFDTLLLYM